MPSPSRTGIVGGGASAVCLLDALSRSPRVPETVAVFDPSPHLWRGRAYQPDSAALWVNAPPEDMTVREGDPEHFARWLQAHQSALGARTDFTDAWSGIPFTPRALYGDYLEQCARAALRTLAARGSTISVVRSAVVELTRAGRTLLVRTADGRAHPLDHAVVCVGSGGPADPHRLTGLPGFIPDPYPVARRLAGIGADQRVVVLGSGLTAIDVVLSLTAAGHRGKVVLASRRGILPGVRQRPVEHTLRYFTADRFQAMAARGQTLPLTDAVAVLAEELTAAGSSLASVAEEIAAAGTEEPVARLRRQLAAVDSPDPGLRVLQRAVPDTGPDVWPLLPEHDRVLLRERHYRTIMSLCCPMPPTTAATLLAQVDRGRLEFASGVEQVSADPGGGFTLRTATGTHRADVVVGAAGPAADRFPAGAKALIDSLTANGLAAPHPQGGLRVTRATSGLTVNEAVDRQVYVLGDLASGSLFFTFGVPSLVDRAVDIAEAIHRDAALRPDPTMQPA
ncbi:FAD/NAD(P)-binding protein [Kitasatospora viridis]|uniref:Putative NAD(P)/FAD-binding protein YdhS n=1 Tax=Kitasatospora viridis TaxID=281105 RepID=A0A561TTI0_9ACTN|nr:FAD/NAD(P)-binding protein [Kitasatospora viridis]TWF90420.1 putative NAD(P)/FAD-binding protein YdhS [Kitasatospora viridis]